MICTNIDILRTKSHDFTGSTEDLKELIHILDWELQHAYMSGTGLSAIQINIPYRVAILRSKSLTLDIYNAKLINKEQPFIFKEEGCLSLPGVRSNTTRFNVVTLVNGDGKEYKLSGFDAILAQHEIDHFDGILFTDHPAEVEV